MFIEEEGMIMTSLYQVMQYGDSLDTNPKISEIVEWYEAWDIYLNWLEKEIYAWDDDEVSYEEKQELLSELLRIKEVTEND
tara:strand:+ start:365 stop:607 length:243 start_codon:yes stop_codon:yes gene_type:complete